LKSGLKSVLDRLWSDDGWSRVGGLDLVLGFGEGVDFAGLGLGKGICGVTVSGGKGVTMLRVCGKGVSVDCAATGSSGGMIVEVVGNSMGRYEVASCGAPTE
jgi:hypothetical protein